MWNWFASKPCCFVPGGGKVLPAAEAQYLCTLRLAGPVACFHFGCAVCHVLSAFCCCEVFSRVPMAAMALARSLHRTSFAFACWKGNDLTEELIFEKLGQSASFDGQWAHFSSHAATSVFICYFCFPLAACFFRNRGARWDAWIAILCRHTRVKAQERKRELESGVIYIANTWMCAHVYVVVGYAFWCLSLNCCARFGERLLPSTVFGQLHGPRRRPLLGFRLRDLFLPSCSCCLFFFVVIGFGALRSLCR